MTESVINDHVIAIVRNHCKGVVAITLRLSLPVESEFDLPRHCSMSLGHPLLSPSFSACKSSLRPILIIIHRPYCLLFSRIAIWDRNIIVSLIAIGVFLCALALNIRRTFESPVV